MVDVRYLRQDDFYDFHVPVFENYLCAGYWHHNSGKSTVVEAVHFALTGDAARLGRQAAVRVDAPDPRPAVDLEFVPGCGVRGTAVLSRTLPVGKRPGTRTLSWDGESLSSEADVVAQVAAWAGVPIRVLTDFVFVQQGHLADVVTDQPARRAEVLQRLFGVDRAAAAHAAVTRAIAAVPAPADRSVLAAVRTRAASVLADLGRARADLARLEEQLALIGPAEPDVALLRAREDRAAAEQVLAGARAAAESAAAEEAAAAQHLAGVRARVMDQAAVTGADAMLAAWDVWQAHASATYQTENELCAAKEAAAADLPPDPGPAPRIPAELEDLSGRIGVLRALARTKTGGKCPACTQPLPVGSLTAEAEGLVSRFEQLSREADGRKMSYEEALTRYLAGCRTRAAAASRVRELTATLGAPAPPCPDVTRDDVLTALAAHRAAVRDLPQAERRGAAAAARSRTAAEALRAAEAGLPPPVSEDEYAAAAHRRVERRRVEVDVAGVRARVEALEDTARSDQETLDRLEAVDRAGTRAAGWRARLERLQAVTHRDAAPAAAARGCLLDLQADINRRLGHLNAPFRLDVRPTGDLMVEYRDGTATRKIKPDRLSWAERAVLALGWRIAVQDRYAPGVGLLCLDEPTHGLDSGRLDAFRAALEAWRPHGAARQFVVVTHDRRLFGVFDRVVDLGS